MYYKLRLIGGLFGDSTKVNVYATIVAISREVTEFNLQDCFSTNFTSVRQQIKPDELCQIIKSRPNVTSINFSLNQLGKGFAGNSVDDLISIFTSFPENLASLDLSYNALGDLSADDLIKVLKALPVHLTSLNLEMNCLSKYSADDLIKILNALPRHLTSLNLGWNDLSKYSTDELVKILKTLSPHLTSLNLEGNTFYKFTYYKFTYDLIIDDLVKVLKAFPTNLLSLNLGNNFLCRLSVGNLTEIFTIFSKGLTALDWSENNLDHLSPDELAEVFSFLPENLDSLDISRHFFDDKQITALFNFLAKSKIQTLGLESSTMMRIQDYKGLSEVVIKKLQDILSNNQRKGLLHANPDRLGIYGLQALCGRAITLFNIPLDVRNISDQTLEIIKESQQVFYSQGLKL
ncbi:MAG: hypothetical protein QM652_07685 [Legionella sp.]|uniref:hypothetical protein n=1 Tax=Legionella sp. TaxID=459 RepID=UPI0039E647D3